MFILLFLLFIQSEITSSLSSHLSPLKVPSLQPITNSKNQTFFLSCSLLQHIVTKKEKRKKEKKWRSGAALGSRDLKQRWEIGARPTTVRSAWLGAWPLLIGPAIWSSEVWIADGWCDVDLVCGEGSMRRLVEENMNVVVVVGGKCGGSGSGYGGGSNCNVGWGFLWC
jgi:hypothetical protein